MILIVSRLDCKDRHMDLSLVLADEYHGIKPSHQEDQSKLTISIFVLRGNWSVSFSFSQNQE